MGHWGAAARQLVMRGRRGLAGDLRQCQGGGLSTAVPGREKWRRVVEAAEPPHVQHVLGVILPASKWVGSVVRPFQAF